jgi:hypothetical protein
MTEEKSAEEKIREGAIKEFEALRGEILARVVMRDQMVNYCATLFAAVMGLAAHVGIETNQLPTALILLAYPPVALVFAHGWVTHDLRIWEMGCFILHRVHLCVPGLQWEDFLAEKRERTKHKGQSRLRSWWPSWFKALWTSWFDDRRQNWFALGAFVGTSVLAVVLGIAVALMHVEKGSGSLGLGIIWGLIAIDSLLAYFTARQIWARSREMDDDEEEAGAGSAR